MSAIINDAFVEVSGDKSKLTLTHSEPCLVAFSVGSDPVGKELIMGLSDLKRNPQTAHIRCEKVMINSAEQFNLLKSLGIVQLPRIVCFKNKEAIDMLPPRFTIATLFNMWNKLTNNTRAEQQASPPQIIPKNSGYNFWMPGVGSVDGSDYFKFQ